MNDMPPTRSSKVPLKDTRLASLRNIIAVWDARIRFRRRLEQKPKDSPHLIADIGLTKRQVAAEIVKRFWQA